MSGVSMSTDRTILLCVPSYPVTDEIARWTQMLSLYFYNGWISFVNVLLKSPIGNFILKSSAGGVWGGGGGGGCLLLPS